MNFKQKIAFVFLASLAILLIVFLYPYAINSAVLDPKGLIALKQADLMWIASVLMLVVVIPVFIMTFGICMKYRAGNKNAEYSPNWDYDFIAEAIWWGFPCMIVVFLSVVTWKSSHELDPFKPITTHTSIKPIRIQVVALQWKWLFIYPEEKIASINFIQFPEQAPLNFEITSDAPMNSFWIPQLGGQIYAMPGMSSKLHLVAQETGEFRGSSANLSGVGFAGMTFIAKSSSQEEFDEWVKSAGQSKEELGLEEYQELLKPSQYNAVTTFKLKDDTLYNHIVMKYMKPKAVEGNKVVDNRITTGEMR